MSISDDQIALAVNRWVGAIIGSSSKKQLFAEKLTELLQIHQPSSIKTNGNNPDSILRQAIDYAEIDAEKLPADTKTTFE
ncbi:MAG: hypothetical protein CMH98_03640 [Oceanospirillaceae bacterium]|nr:hypothetical protein [Oceanospirillaceae bacterium]